ncbi:hypothetical protein V6N13_057986 [Hibiscus sabdariffa]
MIKYSLLILFRTREKGSSKKFPRAVDGVKERASRSGREAAAPTRGDQNPGQVVLVVRSRSHVVNGGGFALVVFCILGTKRELVLRDANNGLITDKGVLMNLGTDMIY